MIDKELNKRKTRTYALKDKLGKDPIKIERNFDEKLERKVAQFYINKKKDIKNDIQINIKYSEMNIYTRKCVDKSDKIFKHYSDTIIAIYTVV